MPHTYGLILAGGRGTRFWPRSRRAQAKQVLRFFGGRSLIQQTVDRLKPVLPPERIWILTNHHLRAEIARQLPEVPKKQILAEPAQRNTAPAIGLAARILESIDPDAVMGVFPADQVIEKPREYVRLLKPAFRAAAQGKIVVLGIKPRWAETGYGYIEFPPGVAAGREPVEVKSFREKPEPPVAQQFFEAGNFYWNAGMFFWRARVLLDALREFLPKTATLLASIPDFGSKKFAAKMAQAFPKCENISIDYAVLEPAKNVVGIPAGDIGWNDVGSWNAVYELQKRDAEGNAVRADCLIEQSSGNYVDAEKKLVALLGVRDLIIVDTPDALLIADRSRAQQVGEIVKRLEKSGRDDLL
ncbi:MAG TPA: mannose-1-phosphate guanylyltransferase [Bryobacteraceae bacterium]|nr:mannose-1-phosphate guanylyltransferase [Bryobacteraceae bacterium]